jgi:hypothetical protein
MTNRDTIELAGIPFASLHLANAGESSSEMDLTRCEEALVRYETAYPVAVEWTRKLLQNVSLLPDSLSDGDEGDDSIEISWNYLPAFPCITVHNDGRLIVVVGYVVVGYRSLVTGTWVPYALELTMDSKECNEYFEKTFPTHLVRSTWDTITDRFAEIRKHETFQTAAAQQFLAVAEQVMLLYRASGSIAPREIDFDYSFIILKWTGSHYAQVLRDGRIYVCVKPQPDREGDFWKFTLTELGTHLKTVDIMNQIFSRYRLFTDAPPPP